MADPNRRTDIIAAARQVFAEDGFQRATIKRIAEVAHLKSSALIYWYFKDKQELLEAVLLSGVELVHLGELDPSFFQQPPEVVLPTILRKHLSAIDVDEMRKVARIALTQMMHDRSVAEKMESVINPVFALVRAYLDQQVAIGRFRPHDSNIMARNLLAISLYYAMNDLLLPGLGGGLPDRDAYLDAAADNFIRGLNV